MFDTLSAQKGGVYSRELFNHPMGLRINFEAMVKTSSEQDLFTIRTDVNLKPTNSKKCCKSKSLNTSI